MEKPKESNALSQSKRKPSVKVSSPSKKSNASSKEPIASSKETTAPSKESTPCPDDAKKYFEFMACKYFCGNRKNPVCANDGRTYKNECYFYCMKRSVKRSLAIQHPGECLEQRLRRELDRYLVKKIRPRPKSIPNQDLDKDSSDSASNDQQEENKTKKDEKLNEN